MAWPCPMAVSFKQPKRFQMCGLALLQEVPPATKLQRTLDIVNDQG